MENSKQARVLVPISLNAQRFSTSNMTKYVFPELSELCETWFFVPDEIQIFNKMGHVADGRSFASALFDFKSKRNYVEERRLWLEAMRRDGAVLLNHCGWKVLGVSDIADSMYSRIRRNVTIAYCTLQKIRDDVDGTALYYATQRYAGSASHPEIALSRTYVLDEIALSVRLHVVENISIEVYFGKQFDVILNLYRGVYGYSVFDLAEMVSTQCEFEFRHLSDASLPSSWVSVRSVETHDPCLG
jgi:hypothetical protein